MIHKRFKEKMCLINWGSKEEKITLLPCCYYPMIFHLIELIILPGSFICITYVKNILHFHVNEWYKISIFNPKGLNSQKGK